MVSAHRDVGGPQNTNWNMVTMGVQKLLFMDQKTVQDQWEVVPVCGSRTE